MSCPAALKEGTHMNTAFPFFPLALVRRRFLRGMALAAAVLAAGHAQAQEYPTGPVRVVVPHPAGGPADLIARVMGNELTKTMGQTFVIDNRPGGGGLVGCGCSCAGQA